MQGIIIGADPLAMESGMCERYAAPLQGETADVRQATPEELAELRWLIRYIRREETDEQILERIRAGLTYLRSVGYRTDGHGNRIPY